MKKFLILTAFLVLQISTVFASVEKHIDKQINYTMEYPIVYTKNQAAQDKINQDIYKYIAAFRNDYNAGKFYDGNFSYQLKFENEKYISLTIKDDRYRLRAAHNSYRVYGLVYDKNSGKKVPLSNFLKVTVEDIRFTYFKFGFYNESGTENEYKYSAPDKISEDYYLLGNGGIALIYQPYEIASFADGATTIRLTAEQVDYFNRKNKHL